MTRSGKALSGAWSPARKGAVGAMAALAVVVSLFSPWATTPASAAPVGQGFNLNRSDLRFILKQIKIAEQHATTGPNYPCSALLGLGPNQIPNGNQQGNELPWGLRQVDGRCNNLIPGQSEFGAADTIFPRIVPGRFRDAETGDPDGPGPAPSGPTSYSQKSGTVIDSQPRVASNLIVDQTATNPAAVEAAGDGAVPDPDSGTLFIPNEAPDVGLSAPFNSWFTLFGQFFDHGLDLVTKGGGTVLMPLKADDPLFVPGSPTNFMVLTRATNQPGDNGILGDGDDVQEHTNTTTSFVDQNQTYTSHPSHQAFLREYESVTTGAPLDTGRMLGGEGGEGLATWAGLKAQAEEQLGLILSDQDLFNVPVLRADPYGNFVPGPNGFPQLVLPGDVLQELDPASPIAVPANAARTGHAFLDDIAHNAVPRGDLNPNDGPGPIVPFTPDADTDVNPIDVPLPAGTYDDELLNAHFVGGDGRANENIGLTAVHHVFHSEHNRLVADINNLINTTETAANIADWHDSTGPAWSYGTRLFQAARFVTEMEYQHLVFEEFARKIQPMVNLFGEAGVGYHTEIDPSIRAEFAHTVYRFGHSMLTESVARRNVHTTPKTNNDIRLFDAFLNPPAFLDGGPAGTLTPDQAAGSIVMGMSRQRGNQIDEFVTEALRNNLLGLPLDLPTINMARGRDAGVPRLNEARRAFYAESANSAVQPYESWADLNFSLRNPGSLVNYIAAYGTHDTITGVEAAADKRAAAQALLDLAATPSPAPGSPEEDAYNFLNSVDSWANEADGRTTTGVDDIDFWVGGLGEKPMVFGGMLGATFNYVFEKQLEDLQDGDRFYYLSRTAGLNLLTQLEGNSFAELVMRNTSAEGLPADAFSLPDLVFNLANLGTTGAIPDDPETEDWNENLLLTRMPNGTIRFGGGEHTTFNGTENNDRMWASEGDDTLRGNDGNDWMQGGDGNDNHVGGLGDDIMLDLAGDDVLKGGDGNDYISSGQGFGGDLNQGGRGSDFILGGNDVTESFGGPGNDFVFAGDAEDTVFGDDGDDWIEGGKGPFNFLNGDNGAPFADDPNEPGHDVLMAFGGEQDYDSEGGDDVMFMGPGIQRAEGMLGFDWATHKFDPLPANSDMLAVGGLPPSLDNNRDRFDLLESLSGWQFDDVLRGDDRTADDLGLEHQLQPDGIDRIDGFAAILPAGTTTYNAGNIIIGGAGSDLIEGRGGDDIIDGDAWLNVRLSVRDPNNPNVEIGSAEGLGKPYLAGSQTTLQQAVLARTVNPADIRIVREILQGSGGTDTAVFTGIADDYTVDVDGDTITVTDNVGDDGVDTLRNVELLQFSDGAVDLSAPSSPVIQSVIAGDGFARVNFSPGASQGASVKEFKVQAIAGGSVVRTVSGIPADETSAEVDGLDNGTSYRFKVLAVNKLGLSSDPSAVSNPVVPVPPGPSVTGTTPGSGAIVFGEGDNLTVTFDKSVSSPDFADAATLRNNATSVTVSTVVSYDDVTRTLTIDPVSKLAQGTSYTLTISGAGANGIRDSFGTRLQTTAITFTTTPDLAAPAIVSVSPLTGATGVRVKTNVVVKFSERVTGVSQVTAVLTNKKTGATVKTVLTVNGTGTRVTLDPRADLARNTGYRLTLKGGSTAIRDVAGNSLVTFVTSFRTRP